MSDPLYNDSVFHPMLLTLHEEFEETVRLLGNIMKRRADSM